MSGALSRHVSGEQGDIFERDTSSFERRQTLVAERMRVQLRELERDSQCIDQVIEGASDSSYSGVHLDAPANYTEMSPSCILGKNLVTLGDFTITPFAIPGHTPGSMGFIFPVKDNGRTHVAALYGGTILTPGIISDEGLQTYLKSVAHFKEETRKAKADVEIQNHPLMDPIQAKLDKLKSRKSSDPNPFVVGEANYQRFVDVMSLCTQVNIARRK